MRFYFVCPSSMMSYIVENIQYFNHGRYWLRRDPPLKILDAHPLWHRRRWAKEKNLIFYSQNHGLSSPFRIKETCSPSLSNFILDWLKLSGFVIGFFFMLLNEQCSVISSSISCEYCCPRKSLMSLVLALGSCKQGEWHARKNENKWSFL